MELEFEVEERDGVHRVYAIARGERVSWLSVVDLYMHYGRARIKVGGVAGVYTPREHRRKGYSRATINYALRWMRERGYQLTALFGIQEYYHKFGYATFMGEHVVTVSLRDLSRVEQVRGYEAVLEDNPAYRSREVAVIYEESNRRRVASRVREPGEWRGFRKGVSWEHEPKVLAIEAGGELLGYAALERWPDPPELAVAEVGARGDDYAVYRALLAELYKLALEERKGYVRLYLPPDHPMADLLRAYGCRVETHYPWSGGGMARVVDPEGLFKAIAPELEERLRGLCGSVEIRLPTERLVLRADHGTLEVGEGEAEGVVELGWGTLAQLVLGYRDPREVISQVPHKGRTDLLLEMFHRSIPYVWQPDRW